MIVWMIVVLDLIIATDSQLFPGTNVESQLISAIDDKPQLWIESLSSSMDDRKMFESLGEIMVFDGGTWNVLPKCKSCGTVQNIVKLCPNKDEYLNLCGECVGGKSEKDDNFGLDSCGVCGGHERCISAVCEEDNFEDFTTNSTSSCSKKVSIWSKAIDMAGTSRGTVRLIGATSDFQCSFNDEESDLGSDGATESNFGVEFTFDLPLLEGKLEMRCNSSEKVAFSTSLSLVDSKKLTPFSIDKTTIEFGQESKVTLSVGNMRVLSDLLCFAKDGDEVVYKYWSNNIEGNSLSSKIVCEKLWPRKVGLLKIGVAYSEEAVLLAKTLDIKIIAKDLVLLQHTWSIDVLTLYFDQTIAGFASCEEILNEVSNEEAKCWCSGREIYVKFKRSFKLPSGNLEVKAISASTGVQKTFAVTLNGMQMSQPLSALQIKGPEIVCAGSEVSYSIDQTVAKWALTISNAVPTNLSMTLEQQRRENMLLWQNLREAKKYLKMGTIANSVSIDTAFLKPGIEYQIRANLMPSNGNSIAASKNFKVVSDWTVQPVIVGRDSIPWTNNVLYEVDHKFCGNETSDVDYEWTLTDQNQLHIRQLGTVLRIKGGVLSPNSVYNLTVRLLNSSQSFDQNSILIKTQPARLNIGSYIEEIVYGTGHTIILYANEGTSFPNHKDQKYHWSCLSYGSPCLMPGDKRTTIESLGGTDASIWTVPAGSLPVGTYTFTLNISLPSGEWTSKITLIKIVPGEPTLLSIDNVEIEPNLKLNLRASDIVGDCEIRVESLKSFDFGYTDFFNKAKPIKIRASPEYPQSWAESITIPDDELTFGTTYVFQLTSQCTAPLSSSWLKFVVRLPETSSCCELNVTVSKGSSQPTKLNFNAVDCRSKNPIFTFGFEHENSIHYLVTSVKPNQELYSFPGAVKPVMKSCETEKICCVVVGEEILIDEATSVNREAIMSIMNEFNRNLRAENKELLQGIIALLIKLVQYDEAIHQNVSSEMMKALTIRIDEVEDNLDADVNAIPEALDLLECALIIMASAKASDEDISKVVEFKDKVDEKSSQSKEVVSVSKSEVPFEPRRKRYSKIEKRDVERTPAIDQVKTYFHTDVAALSSLTNATTLKSHTDKFLKKIPNYIVNVCNDLRNEKPVYLGSSLASLSVTRMRVSNNVSVPFCVPNCNNSTGQVAFSKSSLTRLKTFDSVCVGLSYFERDYYSVARDMSSEVNITQWSGVFGSSVFIYSGNKVLVNNTNNHTHTWPLADISLPIYNTSYSHLGTLKCHAWLDEVGWNYESCKTKSIINGTYNISRMLCRCPIPGIYAAFVIGNSSLSKPAAVVTQQPVTSIATNSTNGNRTTAIMSTTIITTIKPTTAQTTPTRTTTIAAIILTAPPVTKVSQTNAPTTSTTPQITKTSNASSRLSSTTVAPKGLVTAPKSAVTSTVPTTVVTKAKNTTALPTSTTVPELPPIQPRNFKMVASFTIDDKYSEAVGNRKQEFESTIKKQLNAIANIHDQTRLEVANEKGKTEVILKVDPVDTGNIPVLNKLLNNGTLVLNDLNNKTLTIPKQNIKLYIERGETTSTIAIITSAIFISAAFVLAVLLSGIFLKWKRQQRALSFIQNMEISAPKYLRLQETSYIEQAERSGSSENLRSGDLDSGIVLTVDPARVSTKYYPGRGSRTSQHPT